MKIYISREFLIAGKINKSSEESFDQQTKT